MDALCRDVNRRMAGAEGLAECNRTGHDAAYPGGAINAEIDKGTLGEGLKDLPLSDIEACAVSGLVGKDGRLVRGSIASSISGEVRFIVAAAIWDFATTAAVTGPLAIALWDIVSRKLASEDLRQCECWEGADGRRHRPSSNQAALPTRCKKPRTGKALQALQWREAASAIDRYQIVGNGGV